MKEVWKDKYEILKEELAQRGVNLEEVKESIKDLNIETPSWGYSNAGTRFATFEEAYAARNVEDRLEDAAKVQELTGGSPSVAIHIPWDKTSDYGKLREKAERLGVEIGAVNPNLFEDYDYKFGSLAHPDSSVRQKAVDHVFECIDVMREVNSDVLSLWLADGTNYPGQDDFRDRKNRLENSFSRIYDELPDGAKMLIEYKPFEPAFYHTDIADWGMSLNYCNKLGEQAKVLVDTGHHLKGTNIEHIVSFLIDEVALGGFHFNNKKYADDDLTTGSINPYEIFLIFQEIVKAESDPDVEDLDISYMVDQMHIIKNKLEAMIQTVNTVQKLYAKALIVNQTALEEEQKNLNPVKAEEVLKEAYETDVDPLIKKIMVEEGRSPEPLKAFRESGYMEKITQERS
ncbi:L-rhamnose isomerase [Candidatus Bipolaricaulota bacterium]|nr:L-rhamnose isomerase [Candidatus Bipolaricaulota bacterium]